MPITSYRFFHRDNWTDPDGVFCKLQPLSILIDFSYLLKKRPSSELRYRIGRFGQIFAKKILVFFHFEESRIWTQKTILFFGRKSEPNIKEHFSGQNLI